MRVVIPGTFLFVVLVCGCAEDPPLPVTTKAIYTGAEACATCHLESDKEWHGSLHRRSMQGPSVETVRGDFRQNNTYTIRDSLDAAIYWYRKAIELDPNDAVPYHNLALVYAEAGRGEDAEAALDGYRQIARDANAVRELEVLIRERKQRPDG